MSDSNSAECCAAKCTYAEDWVTPVYNEKNRILILDLEKTTLSNARLDYSSYLFPQLQYEEMQDEIDE